MAVLPQQEKKRLSWPLLLSLGSICYIATVVDVHKIPAVMGQVGQARWEFLCLTMGVYGLAMGIRALRWFLLIPSRNQVPFGLLLRWNFVGSLWAVMLPSSIGEDAIRISLLTRYLHNAAEAMSATVLERSIGIVALGTLAGWGSWQFQHLIRQTLLWSFDLQLFHLFLLAATLGAAGCVLWWLYRQELVQRRLQKLTADMRQAGHFYLSRPWLLIGSFCLSFSLPVATIVANKLTAVALGVPVSLIALGIVLPLILLIEHLPIAVGNGLGGLSLRLGLYTAFLAPFGVEPEQAMSLAFLTRLLYLATVAIGALSCVGSDYAAMWRARLSASAATAE